MGTFLAALVAGVMMVGAACNGNENPTIGGASALPGDRSSPAEASITSPATVPAGPVAAGTTMADPGPPVTHGQVPVVSTAPGAPAPGVPPSPDADQAGDEPEIIPAQEPQAGTTTTTTAAPSGRVGVDESDAPEISYEELYARRAELVGQTVKVVGKVFFVTSCPPTEPGKAPSPCFREGYLAHPDRGELPYGKRSEAIPLSEDGRRVSCAEGAAPGSGCPGWDDATRYKVVVTVQRQVLGGRETKNVELDVQGARPA